MNLVIDETIEEAKDGSKNSIGMVVRSSYSFGSVNLLNAHIYCNQVVRGNSIIMLEALERIM